MACSVFVQFEYAQKDCWERLGDSLLSPLRKGFGYTIWNCQTNERTERVAVTAWAVFALTLWLIPTLIGLAMHCFSATRSARLKQTDPSIPHLPSSPTVQKVVSPVVPPTKKLPPKSAPVLPDLLSQKQSRCAKIFEILKKGIDSETQQKFNGDQKKELRKELTKLINAMPALAIVPHIEDLSGLLFNRPTYIDHGFFQLSQDVQKLCYDYYQKRENAEKAVNKLIDKSISPKFQEALFVHLRSLSHFKFIIERILQWRAYKELHTFFFRYPWKDYIAMMDLILSCPNVTVSNFDEEKPSAVIFTYEVLSCLSKLKTNGSLKSFDLINYLKRYSKMKNMVGEEIDHEGRKAAMMQLGAAMKELGSSEEEVARIRNQLAYIIKGEQLFQCFEVALQGV